MKFTSSDEEPMKGIALYPLPPGSFNEQSYIEANGIMGKPVHIGVHQVANICQYLEDVVAGKLPREIDIGTNKFYIRIKLKKYVKKWHGGGGYKGNMGYENSGFLGLLPRVTISRATLIEFRRNLIDLYEIERPDLERPYIDPNSDC